MLAKLLVPHNWVGAYVSFSLIYIAYVAFYFNRKNYSFWFNELVSNVGMPLEQASLFGSTMELSYGIGKLLAGPLVDTASSPSFILWGTLAVSSICNLFLFSTDILVLNILLWSINGVIQSAAWPALAIIFMNWFRDAPNRGTMYSILSTSQNFGSGLVPILLTPLVAQFGWRAATVVPGIIGLFVTILLILFLQETPNESRSEDVPTGKDGPKETINDPKISFEAWRQSTLKLFKSYEIRCLAAGYAVLTVVRVGIADWTLVILQDLRGLSIESAKNCLVSLEVGGFVGGMITGSVSDFLFKGQRSPVMYWCCLLMLPCVATIIWASMEASMAPLYLSATYGFLGLVSFGPHVLVGLVARELYPVAPSTAGSYCKFVGQIGGTLAGYPLSIVASNLGWNAVGMVMSMCSLLAAILFGQVKQQKTKTS